MENTTITKIETLQADSNRHFSNFNTCKSIKANNKGKFNDAISSRRH